MSEECVLIFTLRNLHIFFLHCLHKSQVSISQLL